MGADRARARAGGHCRPLHRGQKVAVEPGAGVRQHLAHRQLGVGSDARVTPVVGRRRGALPGSGGDPRDVRSVPVAVARTHERRAAAADEAARVDDLRRVERARPATEVAVVEVRVRRIQAGIEHRNANAGAGDSLVPERRGPDVRRRGAGLVDLGLGIGLHDLDGRKPGHPRKLRGPAQRLGQRRGREHVERAVFTEDAHARPLERRAMLGGFRLVEHHEVRDLAGAVPGHEAVEPVVRGTVGGDELHEVRLQLGRRARRGAVDARWRCGAACRQDGPRKGDERAQRRKRRARKAAVNHEPSSGGSLLFSLCSGLLERQAVLPNLHERDLENLGERRVLDDEHRQRRPHRRRGPPFRRERCARR